MSVDVNSADWHDGFETASAENCFNERQEVAHLRAQVEELKQRLGEANMADDMLGEINAALGDDRNRCAFVDDAVALVKIERDKARAQVATLGTALQEASEILDAAGCSVAASDAHKAHRAALTDKENA